MYPNLVGANSKSLKTSPESDSECLSMYYVSICMFRLPIPSAGIMLDLLAILYMLRTYRVHGNNEAREHQPGQTTVSGKTYGRFENDALKNKELPGVAEDPAIMAHDSDLEKGGNPFGNYDDDADPRGDAGLPSRYPP